MGTPANLIKLKLYMNKKTGIKTSEMGVQIFPEGEHPRTIRKYANEDVKPYLKSAFEEFLKTVSKENVGALKADGDRAAAAFQNFVSSMPVEKLAGLLGLKSSSVVDESQDANKSPNAMSTGEKNDASDKGSKSE